ncbi:lipase member J isoform X2 [Panthera tigris]|uniref:lipase member J isoform X2 n=1 Tax=Panthera tigris TaxID=9694 RepID=UPI001C6F634F|nr:lipase member J isoform X2 [Panthera tigris]XP_042816290.1 lipase member J isoform X2 [Panthera tigris]XP_042816291.1 lipase member J isoform X2 [Panthera tigris]XP_042816292.1 lipase member J isoform X2 [Panthera tigris]XP_042816293.1 lipase member J isoform X2 [Panthera tigris]
MEGQLRSQMWYLFKVMSFILILGTTHGAFRSRRSVNPEANMNISQIISYWGYPGEVHDVVTEDGYILGLYRIPYGKANNDNSAQKLVVYLQHGLLTSGSSWVSNLLINSLGFILADAGYDVWLGNSRGTTWSRKHLYLKTNSKEFWAFSFDEMAKYDLPASIDFIVKHTGQKEIFYVGHSQGTTIAFITFSTIPKIAEKVKIFFALAPVFSIKYSNSPLIKMAYKWKSVIKAFVGNKGFLPNTSFKRFVGSKLCPLKIFGKICREVLFLMYGCDLENLNMSRMDVYMSHNPAGTSVQNMLHWSQLFNSSRLRAFDWGSPVLNWMHFNQTTSPFYNVTCMNVSTSTWNGARDVLADPQDINNLLSEITNHIYHKTISSYNHIDFLFGLDVYHQVYREIIDIIQGTL